MKKKITSRLGAAFGIGAIGWLVFITLTRDFDLWRGVFGLEWLLWIVGGFWVSGLLCALLLATIILFPRGEE